MDYLEKNVVGTTYKIRLDKNDRCLKKVFIFFAKLRRESKKYYARQECRFFSVSEVL